MADFGVRYAIAPLLTTDFTVRAPDRILSRRILPYVSPMRFPPSFLDDIRGRVAISSVVGRRVAWDRRKTNPGKGDYWACCPFHGEKSASFHVDDRKGRYHCFGCKASGDIFTFLVEKEGVSFPEAVERLAMEAGLPMPVVSEAETRREEIRDSEGVGR